LVIWISIHSVIALANVHRLLIGLRVGFIQIITTQSPHIDLGSGSVLRLSFTLHYPTGNAFRLWNVDKNQRNLGYLYASPTGKAGYPNSSTNGSKDPFITCESTIIVSNGTSGINMKIAPIAISRV